MKARKKIFAAFLAFCMMVTAFPISAYAKDAAKVWKVTWDDDYYGDGIEVDIDFASRVQWKRNVKITVKDNKGKSYDGYLESRDSDECEIYIDNAKYGRTYTIKISGVKKRGASSYGSVTVKVTVPKKSNKIAVKKIDYDEDYDYGRGEYTVEIEFNKIVQYKSSSYVLIKDKNGKAYSKKSSYVDWEGDECEVVLSKRLQYGKTYTYEIVNVRARGETKYTTLKGTFTAR
ncbi:MAG: hypothetical protein NC081_01835 [Roseburia sp.]|nr:hypothetical protein [Roseburia sp.]